MLELILLGASMSWGSMGIAVADNPTSVTSQFELKTHAVQLPALNGGSTGNAHE
jgi:hypothetical protein